MIHINGKNGERFLLLPGLGTSTPITGGPTAQEAKAILDNFDAAARKKIYEGFFGLGKPIDPFVEQKQFPTGNGVSRPSFNPTARAEDINIHVVRLGIEDRIGKALFLAFLSKRIVVNAAPLNNAENEERGATLKVQIRQALQKIIAEEKHEAAAIEAEYSKKGWWGKKAAHAGALGTGLWNAAVDTAKYAKDVLEVQSYGIPQVQSLRRTYALFNRYQQGDRGLELVNNAEMDVLIGLKKDVIDVLGFDPTKITREQFDTAMEVAELTYSDNNLRSVFAQFAKDYVKAQHELEISELIGGGAFEIILTVVLAAVTGGVGAVASLGSKARYMKNFQKVGDLVMDYVKIIQRRKKLLEENNDKSRPANFADFETTQYIVVPDIKKVSYNPYSESEKSRKTKQIPDKHGTNEATWTVDSDTGRPISVEATLNSVSTTKRSHHETTAQQIVGDNERLGTDEGGHIIGHRFMSDQGEKNLFPQDVNLNRGAYRTMENEWAAWISEGFEVRLKVELQPPGAARPTDIIVEYEVLDPKTGDAVYDRRYKFNNISGENFDRIKKSDMKNFR